MLGLIWCFVKRKGIVFLSCRPPQKIVPSPRKFTEDPLCDVQEPSERSGHTCGTSLESSMLRNKIVIVERHCLIPCIPLGADEPCIVWDAQIFRDQELADSWAVG